MTATCVAPTGDRCGEGVVWNAEEAAVYWTDINRFLIHRLDTVGGGVHTWMFNEPVVALALTTRPDTMLVALGSRLLLWRPETDARCRTTASCCPAGRSVRLNDGRADPLGNFWVGSMKNNVLPDGEVGESGPGEGALFRVAGGRRRYDLAEGPRHLQYPVLEPGPHALLLRRHAGERAPHIRL